MRAPLLLVPLLVLSIPGLAVASPASDAPTIAWRVVPDGVDPDAFSFSSAGPGRLHVRAQTDQRRVRLVVTVDGAARAEGEGGGRDEVALTLDLDGGERVEVSARAVGDAIPAEVRAFAVFAPALVAEQRAAIEDGRRLLAAATVDRAAGRFDDEHRRLVEAFEIGRRVLDETPCFPAARFLFDVGLAATASGYVDLVVRANEGTLSFTARAFPPSDLRVTTPRLNLAEAWRESGRAAEAAALAEVVLASLDGVPPAHPLRLAAIQTLAGARLGLGDPETARDRLDEAYRTSRATLPNEHPVLQRVRTNLALVERQLGNLERALVLQQEAYDAWLDAPPSDALSEARVQAGLAAVRRSLGDVDGALDLLASAGAVFDRHLPTDHRQREVTNESLAAQARDARALEEARRTLTALLERRVAEKGEGDIGVQTARLNLARVLRRLDRSPEAAPLIEDAHRRLVRVLPAEHALVRAAKLELATSRRDEGAVEAARDLLAEALTASSGLPLSHPSALDVRLLLVETELLLDPTADVEVLLDEIVRGSDAFVRFTAQALSFRSQDTIRRRMRAVTDVALAAETLSPARALDVVLRFRGESERRSRLRGRLRAAATEDAELARLLDVLRAESRRGTGAGEERRERAERALLARAGRRGDLLDAGPVTTAAVREILPARSAALVTQEVRRPDGGAGVACFLLPATGDVVRRDLPDAREVEALCDALRDALERRLRVPPGRTPAPIPAGARLAALLAPVLDAVPADVDTLWISPDGALASIPFEVLPSDDGGRRLDAWRVLYVESPRALQPRPDSTERPSLLALGGATFHGRPALPGSSAETDDVATRFADVFEGAPMLLLTGDDATRDAFVAEVEGRRFVHVATHADEGLVFAGDGAALDADALARLDLSACELCVLSACATNVGARAYGDAVAGLNRALALAGVRHSIASLWRVYDPGARAFFRAFYAAHWSDGLSVTDAFFRAQQETRDAGFGVGVWAAFVLYSSDPGR